VSDPKILPEVVIYDVDLTMTLSVAISVSSGMNAIAHAVEARTPSMGSLRLRRG
jgi:alcohol dehydrogenase class IV